MTGRSCFREDSRNVMKFQVVFDSTKTVADWWLWYSPLLLIFAIMAAYILHFLWKTRRERFTYRPLLILILVLMAVEVATHLAVYWVPYHNNFYYVGPYQIVEGTVENYQFTTKSASNVERFRVKGVSFAYANHGLPQCFHKTAKDGGPIRQGLVVRISYARIDRDFEPACIVKLETPNNN